MSFEVLKKKYEVLKKSWNGGKLQEVGSQLDSLKLALTEIAFLPTDETENADPKVSLLFEFKYIHKFIIINIFYTCHTKEVL